MRWICPQCGRSVSFGIEDCPHCSQTPEPELQTGKSAGPRRVVMGREITAKDVRRAIDVAIGIALVLVTLLLIWSWPDLIRW